MAAGQAVEEPGGERLHDDGAGRPAAGAGRRDECLREPDGPGDPPAGGWRPLPDGPDPRSLAGVLAALREGRLGPERRGAVALALVGLLACAVAAAVLVRARPQELPAPVVQRPGAAVPGADVVGSAGSGAADSAGAAGGATGGAGAVGSAGSAGSAASPGSAAGTGSVGPPPPGEVVVAVNGTVKRPGLVRLPPGSRVADAVQAAGGVAAGASTGLLNLARPLVDGEQVLVGVQPPAGGGAAAPVPGSTTGSTTGATTGSTSVPGPAAVAGPAAGPAAALDLNSASAAELDALPGIGPVLADRIVAWRERNGPFRSVSQLREVVGIGEAKYGSLREAVRV